MLTFTYDCASIAILIAENLKKIRNGKRIGVIMLEDHKELVYEQEELFVSKCFQGCHYVVPILSTQYLDLISSKDNGDCNVVDNLDHKYARYISSMMTTQYMAKNCRNTKIRCIIPHEILKDVLQHPEIELKPEFRTWKSSWDIEKFAEIILTS